MGLGRNVAGALCGHHGGVGEPDLKSVENAVHCRFIDGPRRRCTDSGLSTAGCHPVQASTMISKWAGGAPAAVTVKVAVPAASPAVRGGLSA